MQAAKTAKADLVSRKIMADVGCAPNLGKQSEIGRYRAASGDVGRYRAVSGDFGRGDVSWAGGRFEKSKVNGP